MSGAAASSQIMPFATTNGFNNNNINNLNGNHILSKPNKLFEEINSIPKYIKDFNNNFNQNNYNYCNISFADKTGKLNITPNDVRFFI